MLLEWAMPGKSERKAKQIFYSTWLILKDIFYGQLLTLLVVEFLKMAVSEARPHFMQTCAPALSAETCAVGWVDIDTCAPAISAGTCAVGLVDIETCAPALSAGTCAVGLLDIYAVGL